MSNARPSLAQLWRWVAAAVGAAVLAACSVSGPIHAPPHLARRHRRRRSGGPSESTSALPPDGRPLQPIPPVRLAGFADPPPGQGLARYRDQRLMWTPCLAQLMCAAGPGAAGLHQARPAGDHAAHGQATGNRSPPARDPVRQPGWPRCVGHRARPGLQRPPDLASMTSWAGIHAASASPRRSVASNGRASTATSR